MDATPTPAQIYGSCVCLALNRAARATTRRFDAAFKPLGITSGQFSLLLALQRPEPVALGRLASMLGMDRTTLNRNLKPLEAGGYVTTGPDADDARVRALRLTAQGQALVAQGIPLWQAAQAQSQGRLPPAAWQSLQPHLQTLA